MSRFWDARCCNGENGVGTRTLKPSMPHHHQNMNGMDSLDMTTGNPDAGGTENLKHPRAPEWAPERPLADAGEIAD